MAVLSDKFDYNNREGCRREEGKVLTIGVYQLPDEEWRYRSYYRSRKLPLRYAGSFVNVDRKITARCGGRAGKLLVHFLQGRWSCSVLPAPSNIRNPTLQRINTLNLVSRLNATFPRRFCFSYLLRWLRNPRVAEIINKRSDCSFHSVLNKTFDLLDFWLVVIILDQSDLIIVRDIFFFFFVISSRFQRFHWSLDCRDKFQKYSLRLITEQLGPTYFRKFPFIICQTNYTRRSRQRDGFRLLGAFITLLVTSCRGWLRRATGSEASLYRVTRSSNFSFEDATSLTVSSFV